MSILNLRKSRLTDKDLEFLIDAGHLGITDKLRLKHILREDEDFRNAFMGNEDVFRRIMDDDLRLGLYKRIADICLFILGIFPDYVEQNYRHPLSGEIRPRFGRRARISPEEYVETGRKFYKLAAEHHSAEAFDLSDVFQKLHENFQIAHKPLNYIADHYLRYRRDALFS